MCRVLRGELEGLLQTVRILRGRAESKRDDVLIATRDWLNENLAPSTCKFRNLRNLKLINRGHLPHSTARARAPDVTDKLARCRHSVMQSVAEVVSQNSNAAVSNESTR